VGVCLEWFRDVEFHDDGLLWKDGLGLLGKRFGIDGELVTDEMNDARGMVRDRELREAGAKRIWKRDEGSGDVRGGGFAEKEQGREDKKSEHDYADEDLSSPRFWMGRHANRV
jgi:hypothetical protein